MTLRDYLLILGMAFTFTAASYSPQDVRQGREGTVTATNVVGTATWFCGAGSHCTRGYGPSDLVAAIDPTTGYEKGETVTVWHGDRSVAVRIVDVCACPGRRIIDLTSGAFQRLAPLSRGVIDVVLVPRRATPTLPATDTAP
jgi:hypothetical protein